MLNLHFLKSLNYVTFTLALIRVQARFVSCCASVRFILLAVIYCSYQLTFEKAVQECAANVL